MIKCSSFHGDPDSSFFLLRRECWSWDSLINHSGRNNKIKPQFSLFLCYPETQFELPCFLPSRPVPSTSYPFVPFVLFFALALNIPPRYLYPLRVIPPRHPEQLFSTPGVRVFFFHQNERHRPSNSNGQLRHLRAHTGRASVRHRLPHHTRAGVGLPLAARQRHSNRASAGDRVASEPVHGSQAEGGADHILVPAGIDCLHLAVPDDWVDVAAWPCPSLPKN